MSAEETRRTARLELLAVVRAQLVGDEAAAGVIVGGTDNLTELTMAAVALAGAVVSMLPPVEQQAVLEALTAATVGPGGGS